MSVPNKFGFIRATLALWAADIGAFIRGGLVSDSPNGGDAWGVNIPGIGWIYAAMRGEDASFKSLKVGSTPATVVDSSGNVFGVKLTSTGSSSLNGSATPPVWTSPSQYRVNALGWTSSISESNSAASQKDTYLAKNIQQIGGFWYPVETAASGKNRPCMIRLSGDGSIVSFSSSTAAPTAGVQLAMTPRVFIDALGQISQQVGDSPTGQEPVSSGTWSKITTTQIANTVSRGSLWGGARAIAAQRVQYSGQIIHVKATGRLSCLNAAGFTVDIQLDGVTIATVTDTMPAAITDSPFRIEGDLQFRGVGAGGTLWGYVMLHFATVNSKSQAYVVPVMISTTATAFDTTAAHTLDMGWTWGASSTSNDIRCDGGGITTT